MPQDRVFLRRPITLALARHDVEQLWTIQIAEVAQRLHQHAEVVTVDRADIVQAQFLEQRARQDHAP